VRLTPPSSLRRLTPATVDFETFSKVLNRPGGFRDPGEPEEYCRGFQVFDKDMTGFIGVGQLRYILTNLGEKMTDDEVDELLKAVDTGNGEVNYTGKFKVLVYHDSSRVKRIESFANTAYRSRPYDSGKLEHPMKEEYIGERGHRKRESNCRNSQRHGLFLH
jgi:hypothetical protein